MPFRFPLQAVFHLRQSIEHQQELRLRAANQQVARVRRRIEQVEERMRRERNSNAHALCAGTTSAELHFSQLGEISLSVHRQQLEQDLARAQLLRDQQQRVLQKVRLERETLEVLREQQVSLYQRERARRVQRELDELFLTRLSFNKGS